jgi:hypothetical protein
MPHDTAGNLYLNLNINSTAIGVEPIDQLQGLFDMWLVDHDGDFNNDGQYDCSDIDLLVSAIATGNNLPAVDLNRDGTVDQVDLQRWLSEAGAVNLPSGGPFLLGDATLDGFVDGSDFNLWNSNKFTNLASWCGGDFTADGVVDGQDFNRWNSNKFTGSLAGLSPVPEPIAVWWLLLMPARFHRRHGHRVSI